jgi:arginase
VQPDLIGVPYTSAAVSGGIADAVRVLREAGLAERVPGVRDSGDLALPEGSGVRGASGLLNESSLGHLATASHAAVLASLNDGRFPLVVGGDCPVLLGPLAAGRTLFGGAGLLFVDGHEDAWPSSDSTTGEASDSEVAIALGSIGALPPPLDEWVPLLEPSEVAMLGPRDRTEIDAAGVPSLAGIVAMFCDDREVRALGAVPAVEQAVVRLAARAPAFWLHVDLDVLSTEAFPAADYRQPGGLDWNELLDIASTAVNARNCLGCSVAIYNPDLDPDRSSADRVVQFIVDLVTSAAT